ncbi:FtsX-like permease family protein [Catalinimonas alkaloidigena]|uniref:FtsX-like permease family protein n=1 Tax=Catalinimonas alkaloidigena TaxID=1075417 RepID=A0A1G8X685_9BACT|nr:ABC transporter permease [Catalinimonas alkaloidigena]SDJ85897.1 FtsX-like permease family protein [Catalinimonas alkaloidigena]
MLKNYLSTALRTLWNHRTYTLLNLGGLTVGLTVAVLLLLWVQDERSFDRMHERLDHIYHVNSLVDAQRSLIWTSTQGPVAVYAKREVPGVLEAVRTARHWDLARVIVNDQPFFNSKGLYVDPSFFTLFSFPLVAGNAAEPFPNHQSVIVTEAAAEKYFGTTDVLGQSLHTDDSTSFLVSGILQNIPSNSSIQGELFFPFDLLAKQYTGTGYWKSLESDWGNFNYDTYLLLHADARPDRVAQLLSGIQQKNHPHATADQEYKLQPLADWHLYAPDGSAAGATEVRIFFLVALVILLIACINYVNLTTARATHRSKEVSMRKIIGADRGQLFAQFLGESLLVFVVALGLSLLLIPVLMPVYNDLSGKTLVFDPFQPTVMLLLGGAFLFTLLLAGVYPAMLLSSFQPLQALKGRFGRQNNAGFRQVLVITQFAFSVVLIVSTLVITKQMQYVREKKLGYDRENVLAFWMRDIHDHFAQAKDELEKRPGIRGVASANQNLIQVGSSTGDTDWDGKPEDLSFIVHPVGIEENFLGVMGIELADGTGFSGSKADSAHFILNETAVREAGITDPVGKRFTLWDTEGTIIGVAKDFHVASVHEKIKPVVFYHQPEPWRFYIKTTGADAPQAIAAAEKIWHRYNPEYPFEYEFMDQAYDSLYKSDQRTARLFYYFAGVAIFVSCLGLLGLAIYTAELRTKEIGIRKVLGASVSGIVLLLSRDFLKLVLLSVLMATPLAWWFTHRWLENFAYSTSPGVLVFFVGGATALLIALLTVSVQSIRTALANPVKALRAE